MLAASFPLPLDGGGSGRGWATYSSSGRLAMSATLDIRRESWPIAGRFTISRGSKTAADVVTVTIADGAAIGRGECVPYARYGESIDSAIAQIESVRTALEAGLDRAGLQSLAKGRASDVRHGIERQPIHVARREQRHDMRMLKTRREPDLALEPVRGHAGAELRREQLHDDLPPERGSVTLQVMKPKAIIAMAMPAMMEPMIRLPCG